MPIPWLIGGAVVAVAAAATAVVASEDRSSSASEAAKARKVDRERNEKRSQAVKTELQDYGRKLSENLAKKYQFLDDKSLRPYLIPGRMIGKSSDWVEIVAGETNSLGLKKRLDPKVFEESALFQKSKATIDQLEVEISELEDAFLTLEAIDEQFR